MKVYLAGPEVFLSDRKAAGARKKAICADRGLQGLYPLDGDVDVSASDAAGRIFSANLDMIRRADVVIANLTPFRGLGADAGTAVEVGLGFAMGKPVYGYSDDISTLFDRTVADAGARGAPRAADGLAYHPDGMSIEELGLADNLMLIEAIRASGGAFHAGPEAFEACVAAAARGQRGA